MQEKLKEKAKKLNTISRIKLTSLRNCNFLNNETPPESHPLYRNIPHFREKSSPGHNQICPLKRPMEFFMEPSDLQSDPKLKDWNPDRIITRHLQSLKQLLKLNIPTIMVPHNPENYPNMTVVKTDGESISRMASDHLIRKGLHNFEFCGYYDLPWSIER